jgi:glycosyltransferase involved in cell wall biosynthesis
MNILLLTPQLPCPPRQGTTIRNYNLLKQLARQHTIDLLTFLAPGEQVTPDSPLHGFCRQIGAVAQPRRSLVQRGRDTLLSPLPDMALRLESQEMLTLVARWSEEQGYDIVQMEGIEMARYGLRACQVSSQRLRSPALVFDDHNCEYLLQQRNALTDLRQPRRWLAAVYSLIQWWKLRRYEAHICRHSTATVVVSAADGHALRDLVSGLDLTVVSNGIDLAEYQVAAQPLASLNLVFTGKMDYRPNIDAILWFGRHVLPLVQAEAPGARLQIVGMNPHARLDELRANTNVEITGAVEDSKPYIQRAAVYVIPMRIGGGTRFKALEAMACGKAIVSTTLGVEGIGVRHEQELLLADTPVAFADAILRLLRDQANGGALTLELGLNARRFVEAHYGWEQIAPKLEKVYTRIRG